MVCMMNRILGRFICFEKYLRRPHSRAGTVLVRVHFIAIYTYCCKLEISFAYAALMWRELKAPECQSNIQELQNLVVFDN